MITTLEIKGSTCERRGAGWVGKCTWKAYLTGCQRSRVGE